MEESTYRDMSEGVHGFESRNKRECFKEKEYMQSLCLKKHLEFSKLKKFDVAGIMVSTWYMKLERKQEMESNKFSLTYGSWF